MFFCDRKKILEKNIIFFKIFFRPQKIFFFDEIFFKVHLLCLENRPEVVSERFRQFKGKKTQGQKNEHILQDLPVT